MTIREFLLQEEQKCISMRHWCEQEYEPGPANEWWNESPYPMMQMLVGHMKNILDLVAKQAADDGLWATNGSKYEDFSVTAGEAYLQQKLRELHRLIEGGVS